MKTCTKCGVEKDRSDFYKSKQAKDGLRIYCKNCDNAMSRERYMKNPSKVIARTNKYQKQYPEKIKVHQKRYAVRNPENRKRNRESFALANPEKILGYQIKLREKQKLAREFKHLGDEPADWVTE